MEEIGIFDMPSQQENPGTRSLTTGDSNDDDKDLYILFKKLQRQLEFLQVWCNL